MISLFKDFWSRLVSSNDYVFEEKILLLNDKLMISLATNDSYHEEILALKEQIIVLNNFLEELESKLDNRFLEYYWNHKITPSTSLTYRARNSRLMNVIKYFSEENDKTPILNDETEVDVIANNCLKWVHDNITYTSDSGEHWQWANETISRKLGDCEDGAILMANMMLKSGVPYWRIRLNAGDVKGGGHAYVTYLRESDGKWYVMDWCYWYNESVNFKKLWVNAKNYFGIWFSWNEKYGFRKSKLDR